MQALKYSVLISKYMTNKCIQTNTYECPNLLRNLKQLTITRAKTLKYFSTENEFSHPSEEEKSKLKLRKADVFIKGGGVIEKKIRPNSEKIILYNTNKEKHYIHLEHAIKIAKHNNLDLIKISNQGLRPQYKLVKKGDQFDQSKLSKFIIGSEIFLHDLRIKLNQVNAKLKIKKAVTVIIDGKSNDKAKIDNIYKIIKEIVPTECEIKITSQSSSKLHLLILPPKPNESLKVNLDTIEDNNTPTTVKS